ncbi:EAL domain-containing protein [Thiomicrorhabdus sediminis]|uniref:cyclic-guanylate-specific phosphodiesterase n=1 Tax=Thiomicrorhabdus sediminis TaxID=2580412 RepID=A0A4P9K4H5_9GAMM|nr:EAL domain-containing protein [Thiomicrorhabdus sediminis]
MSIKHFMIINLLTILVILYAIFADYYQEQKSHTAEVILGSLKDDMSEISYLLSKQIVDKKMVRTTRSLLDRAVSNNDFIKAIMILDDQKVLLTTDPRYRKVPDKKNVFLDPDLSAENILLDHVGFEGTIRFYKGKDLQKLTLVFLFDHQEAAAFLNQNSLKFLLYFGLLPGLIILVMWLLMIRYIIKPLERLRQYAYYQSETPSVFNLKELEYIRSSMAQTFSRLDSEQKELFNLARTDSLSGLANRHALNENLKCLIADAARKNYEFAYLFLDLDNFKAVNDALGHNVGDELLQQVAGVISEVLRTNDFVARVGGDEFVIVLHDYESLSEISNILERIQSRLNVPWIIQGHPIKITSSIGIALYPKDAQDMIGLMKSSDIAMYEAKKRGRNQHYFYTEELNVTVQKNIALDKAMRQALEDHEYHLYYQPKVNLLNGDIIGLEALIRWFSPTKGMIMPDQFIPLAEENGFILELGKWVLQEAFRQQKIWQQQGMDLHVSVNVATKQLLDNQFESLLEHLVKETGVDPNKIHLEITEYLFMDQNDKNLNLMKRLRSKGFSISLDDFGTGYSSLSYLKTFPISELKIDKAFVRDYNTPDGAVFLETIVKMGQTLKLQVIAEGVETEAQARYLKKIGCECYQGYLCSKPLPVKELDTFYLKHKSCMLED